MFYKIIFILIILISCFIVYRNLYDRDTFSTILQIIFIGVLSLIFLDVKNLLLFFVFILLSFIFRIIIGSIFSSRRRIKITRR